MATMELIKKTSLEEVIDRKNADEIAALIARKEAALDEARCNAALYVALQLGEMADNEASRAKRLVREIARLKSTI